MLTSIEQEDITVFPVIVLIIIYCNIKQACIFLPKYIFENSCIFVLL